MDAELDQIEPMIDLPTWCQVGTKEHCMKFVPKQFHTSVIDTRNKNSNEVIATKSITTGRGQTQKFADYVNVSEDLLLLLFCGVAVYSPNNKSLDTTYTRCVVEMANNGSLAYVFSDNSITFGTNQPYGRVIIGDDFLNNHSIHTLFQLMGRAGRVGKFPRASAVVSDETGKALIDFGTNPDKYNIEVRNTIAMINNIDADHRRAIDDRLDALAQEIKDADCKKNMKCQTTTLPAMTMSDTTTKVQTVDQNESSIIETNCVTWEDFEPVPEHVLEPEPDPEPEPEPDSDSEMKSTTKSASNSDTEEGESKNVVPISKVIDEVTERNDSSRSNQRPSKPTESNNPWRRSGTAQVSATEQPRTVTVSARIQTDAPVSNRYVPPPNRRTSQTSERNNDSSNQSDSSSGFNRERGSNTRYNENAGRSGSWRK